jgi:hypothetical protein
VHTVLVRYGRQRSQDRSAAGLEVKENKLSDKPDFNDAPKLDSSKEVSSPS